ncbi:MAG: GNAT family N-acetyltransferase [Gammaproteobacteria bacterium]|nr:GNAT family N-acetyltransferase [Gammaproteobacteria bacterium]
MTVDIDLEDPAHSDVRQLIAALDRYLTDLYPPQQCYLLDVEALRARDVAFFVARRDGVAIGCGALVNVAPGVGEIKRMYVAPQARGLGVGRRLLERLERHARLLGLREVKLETGNAQPEALGLYRSAGYVECGPFGAYRRGATNLFFVKRFGSGA